MTMMLYLGVLICYCEQLRSVHICTYFVAMHTCTYFVAMHTNDTNGHIHFHAAQCSRPEGDRKGEERGGVAVLRRGLTWTITLLR